MKHTIQSLAWLAGTVIVVLALWVYASYVHGLGFPDGFISEQAHARRQLAFAFIAVSSGIGGFCFYLGGASVRSGSERYLRYALLFYLLAVVTALLVDRLGLRTLMDSAGG